MANDPINLQVTEVKFDQATVISQKTTGACDVFQGLYGLTFYFSHIDFG